MKKTSLSLLILLSSTTYFSSANAMGIRDWMMSWECWCGLRCRRTSTRTVWLGVPNGGSDAKQLLTHNLKTDEIAIRFPQAGLRTEEKED